MKDNKGMSREQAKEIITKLQKTHEEFKHYLIKERRTSQFNRYPAVIQKAINDQSDIIQAMSVLKEPGDKGACECKKGKLFSKYLTSMSIVKNRLFKKPKTLLNVKFEYCPFCGKSALQGKEGGKG